MCGQQTAEPGSSHNACVRWQAQHHRRKDLLAGTDAAKRTQIPAHSAKSLGHKERRLAGTNCGELAEDFEGFRGGQAGVE